MNHHIDESEWCEAVRIKMDQVRTIDIQEMKIFSKSHHSLSKISTNVSVPLIETLLRLNLCTRETYEPGALTPFCHYPKMGVMALVLFHQDKSA